MDHYFPPASAMNFTENQQGCVVLDNLQQQRASNSFTDVAIHVNDEIFNAHRNVIAACSPYFSALLKVDTIMKEDVTIECQNNYVFRILMDYIYSGKVIIDSSCVAELLRLANQLMIVKLKDHCCEFLERNLNINNCFSLKDLATKCDCSSLAQTVVYFIAENIDRIMKQREILEFSLEDLMTFLSDESYRIRENNKLWIIVQWVKYRFVERECTMASLLSKLQWDLIPADVVYDALKCDDLFNANTKCLQEILKGLKVCWGLSDSVPETPLSIFKATHDNSITENPGADYAMPLLEFNGDTTVVGSGAAESISQSYNNSEVNGEPSAEAVMGDILENEPTADSPSLIEPLSIAEDLAATDLEDQSDVDSPDDAASRLEQTGSEQNRLTVDENPSQHKTLQSDSDPFFPSTLSKVLRKREKPPKKIYSDMLKEELFDGTGPELVSNKRTCHNDMSEEHDKAKRSKENSNADILVVPKKLRGKRYKHKGNKSFYVTPSEQNIEEHNQSTRKTQDTTYLCFKCDFSTTWVRDFHSHVKTHVDGPPFICDFINCSHESDKIKAFIQHYQKHIDERPFGCTKCDMKFRTRNNLLSHEKLHSGLKPFTCSTCDRAFATKGTLDQHLVTHSDLRPYLCDICGFSTKYQSHLKAHNRVHTGEVYRCQHPGCSYFSIKKSQLGIHMRIHQDKREYVCDVCQRNFVVKSHLVRHQRIHLKDKPYKCDVCDYSTTRLDKLKEHSNKHHKVPGNGIGSKVTNSKVARKSRHQCTRKPSSNLRNRSDSFVESSKSDYLSYTGDPAAGHCTDFTDWLSGKTSLGTIGVDGKDSSSDGPLSVPVLAGTTMDRPRPTCLLATQQETTEEGVKLLPVLGQDSRVMETRVVTEILPQASSLCLQGQMLSDKPEPSAKLSVPASIGLPGLPEQQVLSSPQFPSQTGGLDSVLAGMGSSLLHHSLGVRNMPLMDAVYANTATDKDDASSPLSSASLSAGLPPGSLLPAMRTPAGPLVSSGLLSLASNPQYVQLLHAQNPVLSPAVTAGSLMPGTPSVPSLLQAPLQPQTTSDLTAFMGMF